MSLSPCDVAYDCALMLFAKDKYKGSQASANWLQAVQPMTTLIWTSCNISTNPVKAAETFYKNNKGKIDYHLEHLRDPYDGIAIFVRELGEKDILYKHLIQ